MSGSSDADCRAAPGTCVNIFCPRCRTERAFSGKLGKRRAPTRAISILGGKVPRPGRLDKARAVLSAKFAAMSDEEKRLAMYKVQAGRIMKRVARWPFPDGPQRPVMTRAQAIAAALAGAAAKRARTKLARDKREAERMTDIIARRARGESLRAIGDAHDITATQVLRLIKQRARTTSRR